MSAEFMHPLRLLALPVCAAAVFLICRLRKSRSRKERISHILRYVILALAVLALAGTSLLTASPDRTAWLLVDVSASVNEEETLRLAREALDAAGERRTGVIAFGGNAAVERSLSQTTPLDDLTARVEGKSSAPLAPEVNCGVIVKAPQQKLATPSQGLVRFEEQQLVIAGQGMAASMLIGSLLAPMNELARVGYLEIAGLLFTNPKKTQLNLFLPDGRVAMLSFTKGNRDRFYQLMLQHGVTMPPLE